MIVTRETTTTEKVTVRIEDSRASVLLDKEKETEIVSAILKEADRLLNLNSRQE